MKIHTGPITLSLPDRFVIFVSRYQAERMEPAADVAMISIIDFKENKAGLQSGWESVYIDDFIDAEYTAEMVREYPPSVLESMLTREQAIALKAHIESLKSRSIQKVVVHCHAGRSRSCAIALYVSKTLGLPLFSGRQTHCSPLTFDSDDVRFANQMVYRLLLNPQLFAAELASRETAERVDVESAKKMWPPSISSMIFVGIILFAIIDLL